MILIKIIGLLKAFPGTALVKRAKIGFGSLSLNMQLVSKIIERRENKQLVWDEYGRFTSFSLVAAR